MHGTLLLTLQGNEAVRTFSFDERAQSVLWIGECESVTQSHALVCVERKGEMLLVRPATDAVRLLPAGSARSAPRAVAIERGATILLGVLDQRTGLRSRLYIRPLAKGVATYRRLRIPCGASFVIGRDSSCDVVYESRFLSGRHARLTNGERGFVVEDLKSGMGTAVNGFLVHPMQPRELTAGDVVCILDLVCMVGRDMVCVNRPPGLRLPMLEPVSSAGSSATVTPSLVPAGHGAQAQSPTFFPAPRLLQSVHTLELCVEAPPAHTKPASQPAIVQIGPSMIMGMSSIFMLLNAMLGVARGSDALSAVPLVGMSVTMIVASVVWPAIAKSYERRRAEAEELQRNHRYVSYLDSVECALEDEAQAQQDICRRRMPSVRHVLAMVHDRSPELMSRTSGQDDYLHVRLGVGDRPLDANLGWPQASPSVQADDMWDRVRELASHPPRLRDVPIVLDLRHFRVVGVVGPRELVWEMMRGLMVQLLAGYGYRELKVALVAREEERDEWGWMVTLAHLHEDDKRTRLLATTPEGMRRIERRLERMRQEDDESVASTVGGPSAHCVVLCANADLARRSEVLSGIAERETYACVSLLFMADRPEGLPRFCSRIVDLRGAGPLTGADERWMGDCGTRAACMFSREDMRESLVAFDPDGLVTRAQVRTFARDLGTIRLETVEEQETGAASAGILDLFAVGCVAHLNVGTRWREHDPSRSINVPLGFDDHGAPLRLDLHEDGQGPHGLVAGTTGSGKSELIISLILSLCINYAPDEVSFLIIDYKGGGLAGAFCQEGSRLPHLAGTITNLDGAAIRRTLVSLQSELKRRQRVLNDARARTGEPTMDIRRYMGLYRQGLLDEPLAHLVVVADEFAELRQQEPEFMEELMTASRIGRSLGIHLLLATQKPTGVVSDQIWSNARFKLCLKVADAMDSREMVRRDVAAGYVRPGQFCLLVGYDEEFLEGQCAYAGGAYVPKERYEPNRDAFVELLDEEGMVVAREERTQSALHAPSELDAVLAELNEVASLLDVRARSLWIEPLPDAISLDELEQACPKGRSSGLRCVVGLADDPWNQCYRRLETDLGEAHNLLLYGMPGLGLDGWLCAVVASVVRTNPRRPLWLYGIDMGQGALDRLSCLAQWGGMVGLGQEERMENLFFLLEGELARRREALRNGRERASIVLALANLATWMGEYPELQECLESLVRDGPQFGMHVIASTGSVLGTSMRLRSCFGAEFATHLHDEGDYAMLLGGTDGASLPKVEMRGLVRVDDRVLEFVGAHVTDDELARVVARGVPMTLAPPIPNLPAHVVLSHIAQRATAQRLPIGLLKAGAQTLCASVSPTRPLVVAGDDIESLDRLVSALSLLLARDGVRHAVVVTSAQTDLLCASSRVCGEVACRELVQSLCDDACDEDVVIFSNVLKLLETLPMAVEDQLKEVLCRSSGSQRTALVLVMEGWRAASVYESWLKACVSSGTGVWVGNGLLSQTLFPLVAPGRLPKKPIAVMDGYLLERGQVHAVRLVEPDAGEGEAHGG